MIQKSRPATDKEHEILTILAEECCEVAQAVAKIDRFGWDSTNPYDEMMGRTHIRTNKEMLLGEMADVMAMMEVAHEEGLLSLEDLVEMRFMVQAKKDKLRKYSNIYVSDNDS